MTNESTRKPVTTETLQRMKRDKEKIACLTCYDASFARLLENTDIDVLVVGDSLGMVLQGHDDTLSVTMSDMIYHASCVARCAGTALRIVDLPFKSYTSPQQALSNATRLVEEGGAHVVKPEGGAAIVDTVRYLTQHDILVCGHLGLLPQSVHELGGYRVQGRDNDSAAVILQDAIALQEAGASLIVLECIPTELAKQITESVTIPTIGIGAGVHCDGQVLVLHDILGVTVGRPLKFAKNFLLEKEGVREAIQAYVKAVKSANFPADEHTF